MLLSDPRILPLLHPLGVHFELERFANLQFYLKCPPSQADCQTVQNMAIVAAGLFCVAHEISHGVLKHPPAQTYDLEKEVAADRNAYELLNLVAAQFKYLPETHRTGEPSFLRYPSCVARSGKPLRASSPVVRETYVQRKRAWLEALPPDHRLRAVEFLESNSSSGSISSWRIDWSETPDRLWVDGLSFNPRDLVGKTLTVPAESRIVIAFRSGTIAIAKVAAFDPVTFLRFQRSPPSSSVSELEALKSQRSGLRSSSGLPTRTSNRVSPSPPRTIGRPYTILGWTG